MPKRKKGAKEAQSELMKMLSSKDKYSKNLEKNKEKQKKLIPEKKPEKPDPTSSIREELSNVGPDLVHGVKEEFKKIKSLFKDKKGKK